MSSPPINDLITELHYNIKEYSFEQCKEFIRDTLKTHPKTVLGQTVSKINFVTGKANPKANTPQLQTQVVDYCISLGYNAECGQFNHNLVTITV